MQDDFTEQPKLPTGNDPGDWSWHRARQLEGTIRDDPKLGIWPVTYQRVLHGWGCPHFGQVALGIDLWPQHDPAARDDLAKASRIGLYYRVWHSRDVLKAHARNHGVSAAFRVTEQWRNPPEGRLDFDQSKAVVMGGHCLPVPPAVFTAPRPKAWLDDNYFVGRNSWGESWGNRGYFAMRYDFFDRELYEAWATDWQSEFPPLFGSGIQHVKWGPKGDLDRHYLMYDIVDVDADNRLAWGVALLRRGELHVEDLYVKPEARNRGYGSAIIQGFLNESKNANVPIRFWVPFGDVQNDEHKAAVSRFFTKRGIGFEPSQFSSAAFCAVEGGSAQIPAFDLPPKPAYLFVDSELPAVSWEKLQHEFKVSDEFVNQAKSAFKRHDETLRRLA